MATSTRELVDIALEMADMDELPADSSVYISGSNLNRIMFGIDIGPAELLLARELDCDAVIAHHPAGGSSTLRFPAVLQKQIDFMVDHGVPEQCCARSRTAVDYPFDDGRTCGESRSRAVVRTTHSDAIPQHTPSAR